MIAAVTVVRRSCPSARVTRRLSPVAPDGPQIAFDSGTEGRMTSTWWMRRGPPRRVTDDQTCGIVPHWSRDGASIYSPLRVRANRDGRSRAPAALPFKSPRPAALARPKDRMGRVLSYEERRASRPVPQRIGRLGGAIGPPRRGQTRLCGHRRPGRRSGSNADTSVSIQAFSLQTLHCTPIAHIHEPLFIGLDLSPDGRCPIDSEMRIGAPELAEGVFR